MSHGRMESEVERLEGEIQGLLYEAEAIDEQEDELYSRRKVIVEPVFGQIKEPRAFRRFSLRGLGKVRREWTLVCLCHNLLKYLTAQPAAAAV